MTNPLKLKGKNRLVVFAGGFFLIILLAVSTYSIIPASQTLDDPVYNSGSDKTQLVDTGSNDADDWEPFTDPTARPTAQPTARPTTNPDDDWAIPDTEPEPTATAQPRNADPIHIWQTLYVSNYNADPYWVNAKKSFNLASIWGSKSGSATDYTQVQSMQNNIYIYIPTNAISPYDVISWSFHCRETIRITDQNGRGISYIANGVDIDKTGNSFATDQSAWVTGSTLSGSQLQSAIRNSMTGVNSGIGTYHFIISLDDIRLTLVLSDGSTHVLRATDGTNADNTLDWLISSRL